MTLFLHKEIDSQQFLTMALDYGFEFGIFFLDLSQ